jgi:hypothetical protein
VSCAAALLLSALFAVNVYRAATQSITTDEAFTYTRFVATPLATMNSYYDANNHVLYSLLARLSTAAFGPREFALRLPSLLGGALYFLGLFLVARRLFGQSLWFLLAVALGSLNPLLLDYLSAARGYGLATALWIWALWTLLCHRERPSSLRLASAGVLMGLSVAANLVMLVPGAALGTAYLLISLPAGWRHTIRTAVLLLASAACAAGPMLWFAMRTARRADFFAGAPTARDSIYTLADSSLRYDWTFLARYFPEPAAARNPVFFTFVAGLAVLLALLLRNAIAWFRARQSLPSAGAHLAAATLLLCVVILAILRKGFGVLYPGGRTGLYFVPLLSLSWAFVFSTLGGPGLFRRLLAAAGALVACLVLLQYALEFNTGFYFEVRYDAGTKHIVQRLERFHATAPSAPVRLGVSRFLLESFRYYREAYRLPWLRPATLDGPTCLYDQYALAAWDRDAILPRYRLVANYLDPVSGTLLAAPRQNAWPEVSALRASGFADPIPCAVNFDTLQPFVDPAQPGLAAHVLRDVLEAPGPGGTVWAAPRLALVFHLPDSGYRHLTIDLLQPSVDLRQAPHQFLTIRVNGEILDRLTLPSESHFTYRKTVPSGWLLPSGITLLEIDAEVYIVSEADGQKLAFLLGCVGFSPGTPPRRP